MIDRKLDEFMSRRRATLLGIGPMSKNCVDVVIDLANEYAVPLMLIASRRQIEAEDFGGGYVNNWSTERFAEYVIDRDARGKVILCRDHGGPWQNTTEKEAKLSLRRAMVAAKTSFEADIKSGFEIIHIDSSEDVFGVPSMEEVLERLFELYEFCWSIAQRYNRKIVFEIGTEEQSGTTESIEALEYVLAKVFRFCARNRFPRPRFFVIQTGTRVLETRNVGSFDSPFRIVDELPAEIQLPKVIGLCNRHNIFMKQHNTDYLSDESLAWHPKLGIHAANVAPEFGVTETRAFLRLLEQHHMDDLIEQLINLAYTSGKWKKWMIPGNKISKRKKAVIGGHYVFGTLEFEEIKACAQAKLKKHNININKYLKSELRKSILRYMQLFRLVRP